LLSEYFSENVFRIFLDRKYIFLRCYGYSYCSPGAL